MRAKQATVEPASFLLAFSRLFSVELWLKLASLYDLDLAVRELVKECEIKH